MDKKIYHITTNEYQPENDVISVRQEGFSPHSIELPYVIFIDNSENVTNIIKSIRKHERIDLALVPLYICEMGKALNVYQKSVSDGVLTDDLLNEHLLVEYCSAKEFGIHAIHQKISELQEDETDQNGEQYSIEMAVLRYLYSRDATMKPVQNPESLFAYTYPIMDMLFDDQSYQGFVHLDFLAERDLVSTKYFDRVHHCPHCYCAFLNFRETCVSCGSSNLSSQDLLHHYRCGYEGPESDFKHGSVLECVKCHHELKQIGVDYDRPAQIYQCLDCNQVFQEPKVSSVCMQCGVESDVGSLVTRDILIYQITPLGNHAALHGIKYNLQDEFSTLSNFVEESVFKKFLEVELGRIRRYKKSTSSCIRVLFTNYSQLAADSTENLNTINHEIAEAIIGSIRTTDILCFSNTTTMYLMFTETDEKWSKYTLERLETKLIELIHSSTGVELKIEYDVRPINDTFHSSEDYFKALPNE